jgi:hypothetical protein
MILTILQTANAAIVSSFMEDFLILLAQINLLNVIKQLRHDLQRKKELIQAELEDSVGELLDCVLNPPRA